MPKLTRTPPKYRLHKASGQAVVTLDGRDHYLGPHGSKESRIKCDELVGGWLSRRASEAKNVAALPDLGPEPLVGEVLLAYKEWAQSYYRRNGKLSREYTNIIHALRPLATLYGTSYASSLDLAAFEAVQMAMVKSDLSRRVVNDRMRRIRSVIKWAASRKLIPADVLMAINGVRALRRGQYDVRETLGVKPVTDADIEAVMPHLPPTLQAMIRVQLLTGMRPGELVIMRTCDIDTTGKIWLYRPQRHKTDYLGHDRFIQIGPRAQEMLRPLLRHDIHDYLFSPAPAQRERHAIRAAKATYRRRKPNRKRNPKKKPGDKYTTQSYGYAIRYACKKAEIDVWSPNQLRHTAATAIRRDFGLDAARSILGHRSVTVTEIYADVDRARSQDIVRRIG